VVQNRVIEAARVPGGSPVSAADRAAFTVATALGAELADVAVRQWALDPVTTPTS